MSQAVEGAAAKNPPGTRAGVPNERGLPAVHFIEDEAVFLKSTGLSIEQAAVEHRNTHSKIGTMLQNHRARLDDILSRIPDTQDNIAAVRHLQTQEGTKKLRFELASGIFANAEVECGEETRVALWLGADVMLEYSCDEAIEFLTGQLGKFQATVTVLEEDIAHLEDQLNTLVVNINRLQMHHRKLMQQQVATQLAQQKKAAEQQMQIASAQAQLEAQQAATAAKKSGPNEKK